MKVLIVDDSAFMRTILKDLIGQTKWAGSEVLEAGDGDEAIATCQAGKPDLILLDIVMPGKDGIEVLKEIGYSSQSVVIVSSMGQDNIIDQAKSLGAEDYNWSLNHSINYSPKRLRRLRLLPVSLGL